MFEGRLPAKYREYAPEFITIADGTNVWKYNGETVMNVALNAVAGRPKEEYGIEPTSFTQLRPGTYDHVERVKDMSATVRICTGITIRGRVPTPWPSTCSRIRPSTSPS